MSVYVDNMEAPFGPMLMCHMVADTSEELHEMADAIGVSRHWCQYPGLPREHYDICKTMRARAVRRGATQITLRDYAAFVIKRERRGAAAKATSPEADPATAVGEG